MAVPLGTGGHPPAGRPTPKLAGTVPRNGSYDRYTAGPAFVRWLISHVVTGVRTSSIVGMLGPELLVQRTSGIAGMPGPLARAGNPRGRPSEGTAGSIPRTGGHQPKDWQAIFFNTVGFQESILDFGGYVFEVVCGGCILVGGYVGIGRRVPFDLSFFLSLLSSSIPGCQRCHFRLNDPVQGLEDRILRDKKRRAAQCSSCAVQAV